MDVSKSANTPLDALMYMYNHTFLPPNVPQKDDYDLDHEKILLSTTKRALQQFNTSASCEQQGIIAYVIIMIKNLRSVRDISGGISEVNLQCALQKLSKKGGVIPLCIRAQNSAVIISKVDNGICFEAFELSPLNESVITTKGRLRRDFPASACVVTQSIFDEHGFQATLAQTIAIMSHQAAPGMQPKVTKAHQKHDENRDTTHPKLITEHLMSFLMASGTPTNVSTIRKNTREEVMWRDSLLPWRRSPMWLLVRVSLQLSFSRQSTNSSDELYKAFMAFFLGYVLKLSHMRSIPSDILYAMNAKISRRLSKLDAEHAKPWVGILESIISTAHDLVKGRWRDIMARDSRTLDLSRLTSMKPKYDTRSHLPKLDAYIATMGRRRRISSSLEFEPVSVLLGYPTDDLPHGVGSCTDDYRAFDLAAFEIWVEYKLPIWLDRYVDDATTCKQLRRLIEGYHKSATCQYINNPEGMSIMLLTILELWVACDKSACNLYKNLQEYDPKIPIELLQSLVLPSQDQMNRLFKVEQHLITRQRDAKSSTPPILHSFGDPSAFSVRYFENSPEHQALHSQILKRASQERKAKCQELSRKKEEYSSLMQQYRACSCEYYKVTSNAFHNTHEFRHNKYCQKCIYKKQAAFISIEIHEWPLPLDQYQAKSIIFELAVPDAFSHWRNVLVFLLNNVLKCNYSTRANPRASYPLQYDRGLSYFFVHNSPNASRVSLLSEVKPHIISHRRDKSIAATAEADVCLQNGLKYQYYDSERDILIGSFCTSDAVPNLCTYKLPERSILLQGFLSRPPSMPNGPPPNVVIARQCDCPDHMSLIEFRSLCGLPLGYRIQWMNILVQLSIPSIDFNKVETSIFLLQTIHQAGPLSEETTQRVGHEILADKAFGRVFLLQLRNALRRVEKNWEASRALQCLIYLASSFLSFAYSAEIQDEYIQYLAGVRKIAFSWVKILKNKSLDSIDDTTRTELLSYVIDLALVCASTFDVENKHLRDILSSPSEASMLIQCSITIQENLRIIVGKPDILQPVVLGRWRRLSYRTLPILANEIMEKGSSCLDDAVRSCWSNYHNGCSWRPFDTTYNHWLSCRTASQDDIDSQSVHFNLLTAELLINGSPLTRLPIEYEKNTTYGSLFGNLALEVIPSTVHGMEFSAKAAHAGFTLHLGLNRSGSSDTNLLLHAVRRNHKYNLLASKIFHGKLPAFFIDSFAHWYDYSRKAIEFRSIKDPWSSSLGNWWLTEHDSTWCLTKGRATLISVSSNSAQTLSRILSAIEDPSHIHVFFHEASGSLEIELPRLKLSFDIQPGSALILSRQFSGMYIDANQYIGALIGLQTKLVLKHNNPSHDRMVIIPDGQFVILQAPDHVMVSVYHVTDAKAHAYSIDRRLHRIVDNGDLQSKLFLCYLHGLTSHCIPDLLTQRTGTEQALWILGSAAVRSFRVLTQENIIMLERIASLAPGRIHYPDNERVMQTVDWNPALSFLAQHGSFFILVKAIFQQSNDGKFLHAETHIIPPLLDFISLDLLKRDLIRSSTFRVSGFGAEQHTIMHDTIYSPRDRGQHSERANRAFVVANLLFHRRVALHAKPSTDLGHSLWNRLIQYGTIEGPVQPLDSSVLKYDSNLLKEPLDPWLCRAHLSLGCLPHKFDKFLVMMWLSTAAFAEEADMTVIYTMAAFYNVPDLAQITAPPRDKFQLFHGAGVNLEELEQVIRFAVRPFSGCPDARLPRLEGESEECAQKRRHCSFQSNQDRAVKDFTIELGKQWPCDRPQSPTALNTYLDTSQAMIGANIKFETWFANYQLTEYLRQIEITLQLQAVDPVALPSRLLTAHINISRRRTHHISSRGLFVAPAPAVFPKAPAPLTNMVLNEPGDAGNIPQLSNLLAGLHSQARARCDFEYQNQLSQSVLSLTCRSKSVLDLQGGDIKQVLKCYLHNCNEYVRQLYSAMIDAIGCARQVASGLAATTSQRPRVSPTFFLQQLNHSHWDRLTNPWKECIVKYGLALTEVQRAERLLSLTGDPDDLTSELLNIGHQNWQPFDFPESLLLEIESGIMIREVQEDIARQIRSPPSGENAVMQLNMGEGKSSVIVPVAAAVLADGKQIVRVVVAKPQFKQMSEVLVSKLGGLLGRRVYHMPFSRALKLDISQADAIGRIYRDCMANRGILLIQPEHILSLKLMGLECLATGRNSIGKSLLTTQHFFDTCSRDIVDESDENFSTKFELIYTMGAQRPIELSPDRWTIIQTVLKLVARFAPEVKLKLPFSVEVDDRVGGRFPKTRILRSDADQMILERIANHICKIGIFGLPVSRQPEDVRQAVFEYITKCDLTAEEIARVENGSFWDDLTRGPLLLVRGLIAGGVLSFALGSKRWRVDYGLDSLRLPKTKLAVPFRAKDSPTPRSEFSHPDIVLILTTLSYYYGGLEDDDLFASFGHVIKSDQAQVEYGEWTCTTPDLSDAFRQLSGVNVKDRLQCLNEVFPALRYSKGAIDYFLTHLVFPKEIKEFPYKISASSWDIGQVKKHPTTGFSGTNDSRHVLPLSVKQLDLPEQKHTNALVLEYLLGDENTVELIPQGDQSIGSDAELLLVTVNKLVPAVRVILDVGAQILELTNLQVAETWLNMWTDNDQTKAVVFFDDNDELLVLDRQGQVEHLQTSPFAKQLNVCLIFLDQAHTRGTDLKLPSDYRAAVTLGAGLTKDRLVQACMRMRKLGKGQSVVFCVPEEIKRKIIEKTADPDDVTIKVVDVLLWAISETSIDLRRSIPPWATQGRRFEDQKRLWDNARKEHGYDFSQSQAKGFLEEEAQTLDLRYRPRTAHQTLQSSGWDENDENICRILKRCQEFECINFHSADLQEEQERELSLEPEQERQVERPASAEPATHIIHTDVEVLVRTGELKVHSSAFLPAFKALQDSTAAAHLDVSQFPHDLYVTHDFAHTIETSGEGYVSDGYQRPVQWILTVTGDNQPGSEKPSTEKPSPTKYLVIISPFEADALLNPIKKHRKVTLHLYTPRTSLDFHPLDTLDLYTIGRDSPPNIPRHLIVHLNLFAGQLYLNSFAEYIETCNFLGLAWRATEQKVKVGPDGFIIRDGDSGEKTGFRDSPVKFFKVLMTKIRRDCEGIEKTHLGKILDGVELEKSDFGGTG